MDQQQILAALGMAAAAATAAPQQQLQQTESFASRDPPATLQTDEYPEEEEEEEDDDEEEEEEEEGGESSFIKMEESHSHDEQSPQPQQQQQPAVKQEEQQQQQQQQEEDVALPMLGGRSEKMAYCLLDGVFEKDGARKRVTIPLTRLPAVLGRSHNTGDINFFSLGPAKALSRQHCVIDYRDNMGGKLVTPKSAPKDTEEEQKLEYQKGKPFTAINQQQDGKAAEDADKENTFPPRGAFVMEALGKNLIMVGNQRLRQGEVAILTSGTPIRMSAYSLYFLLPTDTSEPPKTMEIPLDDNQNDDANNNNNKASPGSKDNNKKPPMPAISGGFKRKMPGSTSPQDIPKPKVKKPKAAPFSQLQAELDALPIETLLERMNEAVESERWERKHQLIGSTISLHAVKDATSAPEIREQAADGGVARTEIMRWIKESPKYAAWVEQMNSKMEAKSYQNTITKALLKAGNVRTGSGGRYIKWILPGVTLKTPGEGVEGAAAGGGGGKPPSGDQKEEEHEEEADGDEEEEEEEEEEEDEGNGPANAGPPSSFADFAQQQLQEEESEEDESMMREGAGFGEEAESGNEHGQENHQSPSQPENESMGEREEDFAQ